MAVALKKRSWWRWIIWLRWLWICWMVMMVMITSLMTMMNVNIGSDASWNFYHLLKYQGGVPPCDIIVVVLLAGGFNEPSNQDDCCPVRNCTSRPPRMLQWECFTTCKTFATACFWLTTWHNLLIYLAQSFDLPGTISAVSLVAMFAPPSNTIESGREGGVQAVWVHLSILWLYFVRCETFYWQAPHGVEWSPAGVACDPRNARVKKRSIIPSPTDDQPPPRQEREAVVKPWLRQIRDGAGVGGREQFHTWEVVGDITTSDHHLPWGRRRLQISNQPTNIFLE